MRDNKLFKKLKKKWPLLEEPDFVFVVFTMFVVALGFVVDYLLH